jgi:hypothetical protein
MCLRETTLVDSELRICNVQSSNMLRPNMMASISKQRQWMCIQKQCFNAWSMTTFKPTADLQQYRQKDLELMYLPCRAFACLQHLSALASHCLLIDPCHAGNFHSLQCPLKQTSLFIVGSTFKSGCTFNRFQYLKSWDRSCRRDV